MMTPVMLKCEYLTNPIGINREKPRFSWQLPWKERGQLQVAYRIIVCSTLENVSAGIGDIWDSGRIDSSSSVNVQYGGRTLESAERYHWSVMCWDRNNNPTPFSPPVFFEMSILSLDDWKGYWIAGDDAVSSPLFRKAFSIRKKVKKARAYICGLGYYELYINGKKVGDHVLDPNWSDYDSREMRNLLYTFDDKTTKRVMFVTYDITEHLSLEANAVGVILGNGWYNQRERNVEGELWYGIPRFIIQMNIEYADGATDAIFSDTSWKTCSGPIIFNNIYFGEEYDARLEVDKWSEKGCNDSDWQQAQIVNAPEGRMTSQLSPPDRVIGSVKPIKLMNPEPGLFVYDMGQNFSGWVRLTVTGQKGSKVTLRFAEEIDNEGLLNFKSTGGENQIQKDVYILKGSGGEEVYEPRFTWHGFRYVEITGYLGIPKPDTVIGRVVHSDVRTVGRFECSNPLINRIQNSYIWTQLSNLHGGVPSDCPHRERLGYTGDGHITAEASMFNFDMAAFYEKWLIDISDSQNSETGFVPHTAPFYGGGGGPAWGSAYILIVWNMYIYYEDIGVLRDHYYGMRKWVNYLTTKTGNDFIVRCEEPDSWFLGDWCLPDDIKLPPELVSTYYYFTVVCIMSKIADILKYDCDSRQFRKLSEEIAESFNKNFFDEVKGSYSIGCQGTEVFPLSAGIVPQQFREIVIKKLVNNIIEHNYHFDTGIFATPLLMKVLSDYGMDNIAYKLLNTDTYPSYGYMLEKGATTLWERWDGKESHNHPMFGSISSWFYRAIAGINSNPDYPGFRKIDFKPCFISGLTYAKASLDTIRGKVCIEWSKQEEGLKINLEVPANCSARLYIPKNQFHGRSIYESEFLIMRESVFYPNSAIISRNQDESNILLDIASGTYDFIIR